jgi:hypothetical protein
MKLFYTGQLVNAELLLVMLEKHGIIGKQEFVDAEGDEFDLERQTKILVPEDQYERAWNLFYAEKEGEL